MPIKPPKIKKFNRVRSPDNWLSLPSNLPGRDIREVPNTIPRSCLALLGVAPELKSEAECLAPLGEFQHSLQATQKSGIVFALSQPKTYLNHRTGSGKTWTLACITYLHWVSGVKRILIIAPPSAAYFQFCGEVQGAVFSKLANPPPVYMAEDKHHRDYPDEGVVIVPWSILAASVESLLAWAPDVLLVDEAHRAGVCRGLWVKAFLDPTKPEQWALTSSQSGALLALGYATPRATLASATPTSTGRLNWHTQLNVLEPKGWGNAQEFAFFYCEGRKAEEWGLQGDGSRAAWAWEANGTSNDEWFFPRLKSLVHVVVTQDMEVPLPKLTFKVVDLGINELNLPTNAPGKLADNKQGTILHANLCDAAERKSDYILAEVTRLVTSGVKKIAVITGRVEHVTYLKKALATCGLPVFHYSGSASKSSMRKPMEYQLAEEGIFLTTFQAGGESLNLHSTEHVLCALCPWDTQSLIQLLGRFQRIGGRDCTFSLLMARGTQDDRIRAVILPRIIEVLELGNDSVVRDIREGVQTSKEEEQAMIAEILADDSDWS